ncbi:MAG: archaellin/type IV pilin N-terminal domain-containing protein [Sulfolobales archaeon]
MLNKGISPVIATVILVAVALVLAVALASWVMGIWGTLGSTGVIRIVSAALNTSNVSVTLVNEGTETSTIKSINVGNATTSNCNLTSVDPGAQVTIWCMVSGVTPGRIYTIEVLTSEGVVTYQVRAKGGPI